MTSGFARNSFPGRQRTSRNQTSHPNHGQVSKPLRINLKSGALGLLNSIPTTCLTGLKASRTLADCGVAEPGVDRRNKLRFRQCPITQNSVTQPVRPSRGIGDGSRLYPAPDLGCMGAPPGPMGVGTPPPPTPKKQKGAALGWERPGPWRERGEAPREAKLRKASR